MYWNINDHNIILLKLMTCFLLAGVVVSYNTIPPIIKFNNLKRLKTTISAKKNYNT